jgi:hypothetical protein
MIQRKIRLDFQNNQGNYFMNLETKLKSVEKELLEKWKMCEHGALYCPEEWAKETAILACAYAYNGISQDSNITEEYYQRSIPIIEQQILKGAVRLSNILNHVFRDKKTQPKEDYTSYSLMMIGSLALTIFFLILVTLTFIFFFFGMRISKIFDFE